MRQFLRENRRMLVLAAVALIAGLVVGVFVGLNLPKEEDAAAAGRLGTRSVLPGTEIERQTAYTRCGHRQVEPIDPACFVGYTEEELAAFYRGDRISAFDGKRVVIDRTVEGCCPEHVILRLVNGAFTVGQTDPVTLTEQILHTLPLEETVTMTNEERSALTEGLVFDSLSDIDAYLESMES